jgi:hypothetical protein
MHAPVAAKSDPLEDWLNTPPIPNISDPIAFWNNLLLSKHPLAQMAIDFLSIPGMLPYVYVAIECTFLTPF